MDPILPRSSSRPMSPSPMPSNGPLPLVSLRHRERRSCAKRCVVMAGSSSSRMFRRPWPWPTPTRRNTCRSMCRISRPRWRWFAMPGPCSSGHGPPSRPVTTRPAPTTSCRPAAWPGDAAHSRSRPTASSCRSNASLKRDWRPCARRSGSWRERKACSRTVTPSRPGSPGPHRRWIQPAWPPSPAHLLAPSEQGSRS